MTTDAFGRTVWQLTAAALAPAHARNAAAGLLRLGDFSGRLTRHAQQRHEAPPSAAGGGRRPVDGVFVDLPALRLPRDGRSASQGTPWELPGEVTDDIVKHRLLLRLDASRWRPDTRGVDFLTGDGPPRMDMRESKMTLSLQDALSTGALRLRATVRRARTPSHDGIWRDTLTGASKLGLPGGGRLDRSCGRSFGSWTRKGAPAHVFDQRLLGPAADSRFIRLQPGRNVSLTARYSN